jgi:hypothetical protein
MTQLLAEFHADKQRALSLKDLSYMQAIHETGARLTHDVKNLLQSLNALCAAINEPGASASPAYHALLQRQLPVISTRLSETLGKLKSPQGEPSALRVPMVRWWQELAARTAEMQWVRLEGSPGIDVIPAEEFSGAVDNLLRKAAEKRLREPRLQASVRLRSTSRGAEITVCDDGSAISTSLARDLLLRPVQSENGLGVGLYQAARYAESAGYLLILADNSDGHVCFRLAPA